MCYSNAGAELSVLEYVRKRDGKSPGTDRVSITFPVVLEGLPGRMGLVRNPFIPAERQSSLVDSWQSALKAMTESTRSGFGRNI